MTHPTMRIFRDQNKQWRWHVTEAGRILYGSSEGYARLRGLLTPLQRHYERGLLRIDNARVTSPHGDWGDVVSYAARRWPQLAEIIKEVYL